MWTQSLSCFLSLLCCRTYRVILYALCRDFIEHGYVDMKEDLSAPQFMFVPLALSMHFLQSTAQTDNMELDFIRRNIRTVGYDIKYIQCKLIVSLSLIQNYRCHWFVVFSLRFSIDRFLTYLLNRRRKCTHISTKMHLDIVCKLTAIFCYWHILPHVRDRRCFEANIKRTEIVHISLEDKTPHERDDTAHMIMYCTFHEVYIQYCFVLYVVSSVLPVLDWFTHNLQDHYSDVIMSAMASQITGVSIVYSIICSGADQRKYKSSASLAFVWVTNRWPVDPPHEGPVARKMFPFDGVIMILSWSPRQWSVPVSVKLPWRILIYSYPHLLHFVRIRSLHRDVYHHMLHFMMTMKSKDNNQMDGYKTGKIVFAYRSSETFNKIAMITLRSWTY